MKWLKNDVVPSSKDTRPILAKFDNSRYWLWIVDQPLSRNSAALDVSAVRVP